MRGGWREGQGFRQRVGGFGLGERGREKLIGGQMWQAGADRRGESEKGLSDEQELRKRRARARVAKEKSESKR